MSARRALFAPEVVQTSAMDCGPAALLCLLSGHGVRASYGRLREACQTDVDGTSIDDLEQVACALGLQAEQVLVPVDHVVLDEAAALPAIAVVRQPAGATHFVVVWRRIGPLFMVMDPGRGRRLVSRAALLDELYVHDMALPAATYRAWAASESHLAPLRARLRALAVGPGPADALVARAVSDPGWRSLAALDAAARTTTSLVAAGALRTGASALALIEELFAAGTRGDREHGPAETAYVARPAPFAEEEQVRVRGAVLLRALGVDTSAGAPATGALAAVGREEPQPWRALWSLLEGRDRHLAGWLLAACIAAGGVVAVESVLLRSLVDVGRDLPSTGGRIAALVTVLLWLFVAFTVEGSLLSSAASLGRRLEAAFRKAFLSKIARLSPRYFGSRLVSDMAERGHSVHFLRRLPELFSRGARATALLLVLVLSIGVVDPPSLPFAALCGAAGLLVPLLASPWLVERDLRARTNAAAASRFFLDALLGLTAIRAHAAERAVADEHEGMVADWARADIASQRAAAIVDLTSAALGFGLSALLVALHLGRSGDGASALLLAWWALALPAQGAELASVARQLPATKNIVVRLLEPLTAPEEEGHPASPRHDEVAAGVSIELRSVLVRAAGHTVLEDVSLRLSPGEHVAVVGPSGAGKSTLLSLLQGLERPAAGEILVDGVALSSGAATRLRQETAWVDPAVQLWNRPLLENLAPSGAERPMGDILEGADLAAVLLRLPEGLASPIGEGGSLLSGGEGQRVRLGRALAAREARLVLLDEPFRGLDRRKRRQALQRARRWFPGATVLCATHDVEETAAFPRVLVVEGGRIVEDGAPSELLARPGSRYAALLAAERACLDELFVGDAWRRLRLTDGVVVEESDVGEAGEEDRDRLTETGERESARGEVA
jgi:ABC-type bacteriocin/lantibiotic exporter with double-glycine peptidase domain